MKKPSSKITYLKSIIKNEMDFYSIPEEYRDCFELLNYERKLGFRKIDDEVLINKGYDVIRNQFFVRELVLDRTGSYSDYISYFDSFDDYFNFVDGDIYNNSCYYQYRFDKKIIKKYKVLIDKINIKPIYSKTIEKNTIKSLSPQDKKSICRKHEAIVKYVKLLEDCIDDEEFLKQYNKIKKKSDDYYISLIIYFIKHKDTSYDRLIKIVNLGIENSARKLLCYLYKDRNVIDDINIQSYSKRNDYKEKSRIKDYLANINNPNIEFLVYKKYHQYKDIYSVCIELHRKDLGTYPCGTTELFFDNFNDFSCFLNGDLCDCDLSEANIEIDTSLYKINENTLLPVSNYSSLDYSVDKTFDGSLFVVNKNYKKDNVEIKSDCEYIDFFFELLYYLNYDLSDSDFLFCEGLINLYDISGINFNNSILPPEFSIKFKLTSKELNFKGPSAFEEIESNEKESKQELATICNEIDIYKDDNYKYAKFNYVFDLHLVHKIQKKKLKTESEILLFLNNVVDELFNDISESYYNDSYYIFGGDISSDFTIYSMFLDVLEKKIGNKKIIFILGNHELWINDNKTLPSVIKKYRVIVEEHGFIFLHNDLLYFHGSCAQIIHEKEINQWLIKKSRKELRTASFAIFGGIGFSGLNNEFNANNGIYRNTINRTSEKNESKRFFELFQKIKSSITNLPIIVLTHMPKQDWDVSNEYNSNLIFMSGHNHRNYFYDDLIRRIYSDNQIGYYNNNFKFKNLYIDNSYDYFSDFDDGVYDISKDDYCCFMHGKNINSDFNRDGYVHMLKRSGYYLFLYESKSSLSLMNGGALNKLSNKDIDYYFNNMLNVVSTLIEPVKKLENIQNSISSFVKKFGGIGTVHGAVIDIDFYNHIYFNPNDLTLTYYCAQDMINKMVYRTVENLLEENRPDLFANYKKLIKTSEDNPLILYSNNAKKYKSAYFATDIYKVSRFLNRLQKLNNNVLTTWTDSFSNSTLLINE